MKNTTLKANDRSNPFKEGYFIDIFPLDGTPDNSFARRLHMTHLQLLKNVVTLSAYNPRNKSAVSKAAKLFRNVNTGKVFRRYEKTAEKYACNQSEFLQMMTSGKKRGRNILIPAVYFNGTVEIEFEDTTAPAPVGFDAALRGIYGDYMQLPPVEARKPHHDFTLWMEES